MPVDAHPGPYRLDNVWALAVFFRFYLVGRFVRNRVYSNGAKLLALWSRFDFTNSFTVRVFLNGADNVRFLAYFCAYFIAATSYCYWACERVVFGQRNSLQGAIWQVCVPFPFRRG